MKLVRYGNPGREKPGLIDDAGNVGVEATRESLVELMAEHVALKKTLGELY